MRARVRVMFLGLMVLTALAQPALAQQAGGGRGGPGGGGPGGAGGGGQGGSGNGPGGAASGPPSGGMAGPSVGAPPGGLGGGAPPTGSADADTVRDAVASGASVPYHQVLAAVEGAVPGQIVGVSLAHRPALTYRVKVLTDDGSLREVTVDARSGALVAVR